MKSKHIERWFYSELVIEEMSLSVLMFCKIAIEVLSFNKLVVFEETLDSVDRIILFVF